MDTKIFLNKFSNKKSVNVSDGLNVSLVGKRKLLPTNDMGEVISSLDVYNSEREACNKIRLTCQVNPICSNVLFNKISEIVKYEGSDHVAFVNYGETGETNPFGDGQVIFKSEDMAFWSGNTMQYQTIDGYLLGIQVNTPISNLRSYAKEPPAQTDFATTRELWQWHPTNAIRDTQLSRNDDNNEHFVYHCGLDILNNHLIRSKTFKCICRMPEDTYDGNNNYDGFNTIADYMRDVNGAKVIEKIYFPTSETPLEQRDFTKLLTLHTYLYDDLLTFGQAESQRLVSTYNGWLGFYNTSKIKSYRDFANGDDLYIERPLMYLNGGDFVDMYPGRDLYSFVPKFNHHRQRIEKNWDYCLTYPSSSTTRGFEDIIETNNKVNSLRTIYFDETRRSDNGTKMLVMYSKAKHGLVSGDYVNIYRTFTNDSGETETIKIIDNAQVDEIVDDFIFTVFNQGVEISKNWVTLTDDDIENGFTANDETYTVDSSGKFCVNENGDRFYIINDHYVNLDENAQRISYKKVVNDIECEYYVRIFSRLPNFKYSSGDTSNEYEIYRPRGEDDTRNLIEIYQQPEFDFESHVSRLAFAENIYSDEVGEIVFTDDIDLSYLKDNLGRPLSEIFLTIVKNNRGYKEWYGFGKYVNGQGEGTNIDININDKIVEYSHCFGKLTCGFEMSDESIYDNNCSNIKRINNIDELNVGYDVNAINGRRSYNNDNGEVKIDNEEIWFNIDTNYYGDLCYYDNYNAVERSIQYIMHRFNTAQRESSVANDPQRFSEFIYDEIIQDDYDTNNMFTIDSFERKPTNRYKEGYCYIPHYQIPIRSYDIVKTVMPDFLTIRSLVNSSGNVTTITTLENHYLTPGDKSIIYDTAENKYYYCTTVRGVYDNPRVFTCMIYDEEGNPTRDVDGSNLTYEGVPRYKLFKMDNLEIPSYARILKDGTCRLIWRDLLNNGFNSADKTLEEYTFTNGAFYINKRVDMYVRRQDPYNLYHLYENDDPEGIPPSIESDNNYIREEDIEC